MTPTKQAFGRFIVTKRQAARLTQRELADRLFVTESAVSKWERGLSYPDITLVASLASVLGVSESELINASDDDAGRQIEREARGFRRGKAAILWATMLAYGAALIVCFIVNLSVDHALTWFWVVVTALAAGFSLTTLPILFPRPKGWKVLGCFVLSLIALFVVVWLLNGRGAWLPIPISAVLFAVVVIFGPVSLAQLPLPSSAAHHRTMIALGVDTVALLALLLAAISATGQPFLFVTRAAPIAAIALVIPWVIAIIIRYLPVAGLNRAALAVAFVGLYAGLFLQPAVSWIIHDDEPRPIDLGLWQKAYIGGNVTLLAMTACLLAAVIIAVIALVRRQWGGRSSRLAPQ